MIKKFKEFESISGTELIGHMGPNWGEEKNSPPIKSGMTDLIYCPQLGRIISFGEYQDMYGEYLKMGGSPLHGFNRENLNLVVAKLSLSESREGDYDKKIPTSPMTIMAISLFCDKYRIKGKLNERGLVDVEGDVEISGKGFSKIPIKFGIVTNVFNCGNNKLEKLENAPIECGLWFDCRVNKLKTLEGSPRKVGSFYCNYNNLVTLEGAPEIVSQNFDCSNNKLVSLEGCPKVIGSQFNFNNNKIRDFSGVPEFAISDECEVECRNNPVEEIWNLFKDPRCIDLLNEFGVIRGDMVVMDRLFEVYSTLSLEIPDERDIKFRNYTKV